MNMVRFRHIIPALLLLLLFFPAPRLTAWRSVAMLVSHDSLPDIISSLKDTSSMEGSTFSKEVKRFIYTSLYVNSNNDSLNSQPVTDETKFYSLHNGMIIDTIIIERHNIFDIEGDFFQRWANKLHTITTHRAISRDLLFKEGDKVDAQQLVRNLYLLRNRNYIASADIDMASYEADTSRIELTVKTYDNWTLSLDAKIRWNGNSNLTIYDENILGSGNKLSIITNFNIGEKSYGGNVVILQSPNLFGTFFHSTATVGKNFDYSYLNFDVSREFINPTDYGGGIFLSSQTVPYDILRFDDSTYRVTSKGYDVWVGASRQNYKLDGSIYLTGRYFNWKYNKRPEVNAVLNPAFHNTKGFLGSFGLYKERYFTANRIYGYGIKEFLPAGYKVEGTIGYADGEFWDSWYFGAEYKIGRFFAKDYYLMGSVSLGGRVNTTEGKWQQGALNTKVLWVSPMYKARSSGIRQFVTLSYTRGWSRLEGNNEMVRFTPEAQPRGFTEYVAGLNRAVANIETVVFTSWAPFGFQTVLFGYADAGLIGDLMNVFANDFYTTFGIGARFKNEHLIFQAIQIRLGVAFGKSGYLKSNIFELTNRRSLDRVTYRPVKPEYVSYH